MTAKRSPALFKIRLIRAYDVTKNDRGYRILVDRVWPRGVTKESLALDNWPKELAPSTELRRWFNHDPTRWSGFRTRYARELKAKPELITDVLAGAKRRSLLLIYGARDTDHNNAVALRDYIQEHFTSK
jgi:uncharacterized protein YeaO (DUF488 family)